MKLKKEKERQCRKCGETFTTKVATRQCLKCSHIKSKKTGTKQNGTARVRTTRRPTRSKLKKELDRVFSIYIRQKYADRNGYIMCVSCGAKKQISEMQNGHYISRSNMWLRWDDRNCWPQCVSCNVFKKGNYPAYTEYLLKKFGEKWLLNLCREAEQTKKWTLSDLEERIKFYKNKIKV